jgi:hypothetical protein
LEHIQIDIKKLEIIIDSKRKKNIYKNRSCNVFEADGELTQVKIELFNNKDDDIILMTSKISNLFNEKRE